MRLEAAFSRRAMRSYFLFAGQIYRLDRAPSAVFRAFVAPTLARALARCGQDIIGQQLREHDRAIAAEVGKDLDFIDRWWLLNLLAELREALPLYETWREASLARPLAESHREERVSA